MAYAIVCVLGEELKVVLCVARAGVEFLEFLAERVHFDRCVDSCFNRSVVGGLSVLDE